MENDQEKISNIWDRREPDASLYDEKELTQEELRKRWDEAEPISIYPRGKKYSNAEYRRRIRETFGGDALAWATDYERRQIEAVLSKTANPDDMRKRLALAAFYSQGDREKMSYLYRNLDRTLELAAGEKTSVEKEYAAIAGSFKKSLDEEMEEGKEKKSSSWYDNVLDKVSENPIVELELAKLSGFVSMSGKMSSSYLKFLTWTSSIVNEAMKPFLPKGAYEFNQAYNKIIDNTGMIVKKENEEIAGKISEKAHMNPDFLMDLIKGDFDKVSTFDFVKALAQASPDMTFQLLLGMAAPYAVPAYIGATETAQKAYEVEDKHPEWGTARKWSYIGLSAANEALLDMVTAKIMGGSMTREAAAKIVEKGLMKYIGKSYVEEGGTEFLQQLNSNILDYLYEVDGPHDDWTAGKKVSYIFRGALEAGFVGGVFGAPEGVVGFQKARDIHLMAEGIRTKYEKLGKALQAKAEKTDLSEGEQNLLRLCNLVTGTKTPQEAIMGDHMIQAQKDTDEEIRNSEEFKREMANAAEGVTEDAVIESIRAQRRNLTIKSLGFDPLETFETVAEAAQGFENVHIEAISGAEGLTADAKAEAERLGIDPSKIRAWYSPKDDKIFINAARVRPSEVPYLLLHEAAVHKGLPGVLGKQYDSVMDSIYGQFRKEIEAVNELYHYDLENEGERRAATEEYLAERAEFGGHDWRAYEKEHFDEVERYIAENGLSPENRRGAVRGLMAENGDLEMRPSRWKEFLQRVKMFFRKWKGFENYRFTDQEIETLIMRGLRKAKGRNKPDRLDRLDRFAADSGIQKDTERFTAYLEARLEKGTLKATSGDIQRIKDFYDAFPLGKRIQNRWGEEISFLPQDPNKVDDYIQHFAVKRGGGVETFSQNFQDLFLSLEDALKNPDERILTENENGDRRICFTKRIKENGNHFVVTAISENGHLLAWTHMKSSDSYIEKQRQNEKAAVEKYGVVNRDGVKQNLTYDEYLKVKEDMPLYLATAQATQDSFPQAENLDGIHIIDHNSGKVKGDSEKNAIFSVDQTETEEFKRWFGKSKVVDDEGNPLVVYHGTLADFTEFRKDHIGSRYSYDDRGFFFLDRKSIADDYARSEFDSSRKGKVLACYVSLQKPLIIDRKWTLKNSLGDVFRDNDVIDFWDAYQPFVMDEVDRAKADGVIVKDGKTTMVVAFEPNQIKSATDNIGTFDPGNPDIRFSVESYSEEDWANMVTFMKPYVGRAMERNDADYLKHLRDNGFDVASESDAQIIAAEALKANQRDQRAAGRKAMFDWLILNDFWFGRIYDAIGKTDFLIRPSHRFVGEDFTGSYISPEFVKYSGKLKVKDKESKLEKAKGYHSDELAKLIASKTGEDELEIEQNLIDYFRHLKKRSSKADKENGELGLYDKYSEWKASSPLLNAKLDEKLQAEWEAEKQAQLEDDFISLVEHGTQIDAEWVADNRELWKMLYKRLLSKEAPYKPSKKDLDALNAALRQEGSDAASYAKGWADAKAALIEEKRKEFREFREKVLSSKAEALKLQDEAWEFARKHLPKENQGEFARAIVALMKIDNTPTRKHPEGKRKEALEALFEKILARGEELRRKELLEDFEKRMKQMGMRADGSGKLIGRSDPDTQAQIEKIIEAVKLDPDEVIMRTDELTQRLEAFRDAGEEATEIEIELAILDRYGALYHKDLVDLEDASSSFRALAVTGRNNLKELIEKRARELEGKRNHIEDLVSRGEVTPQDRRSKLWFWKLNKIKRGLAQSFWELNSLDSLVAYQNRPGESDKEIKSLQERINRADEEGKTLNRKAADALIEEIDRLFKVKGLFGRYDRTTVLKALRERVEKTGVFRMQAKKDEKMFDYRRLTPEEAEEMLRDYDHGGKLLTDYEAEALRHQMRTRKYRLERKQSDYFRDGVTDPVINEMLKMGDQDKEGMYYIPTIKFAGTRVEEALNQMEALYLRLLWDQKDVRYKMRFNGWDEESIAGLDKFLKPEVKELGKWMVEQLDADRAGIGKVYEKLYFSRFPHEENYFPTVYDTSKEGLNGRITVDLTQEGEGSQPMYSTPGAMKLRRFHLQEPKIADALTIFTNHRMMMNHFVSHGEIARELRGIYLNKRISESLQDVYGVDYYKTMKGEIADFIHGGNANVRNNIVCTYMLNNWARIKMLWNVVSASKQMFGGIAYMKYGDIPASAMVKGIVDFWHHPVENAKHLIETEYFKNRWQSGMNREMRSLMDSTGLNSGKWQTLMRDLDGAGFFLLRFGDAFSVIAYGHAVYKYHYDKLIQEGMSKADAERGALAEWRMATERTQQSGNVSMLNSWQKGSFGQKMATTFLSNPILLCQSHSRDIYNAIRERHKGAAISAAQKLLVSGIVSVIMTAIGQMFRHGTNFDKYELGAFASDALADEICGIPGIGPVMSTIFSALNGGREKSIPVLDDISRSVRSGYRIMGDIDKNEIDEDTMKDVITVLQGMGLVSAPAAQAGSFMREIRRFTRIGEK